MWYKIVFLGVILLFSNPSFSQVDEARRVVKELCSKPMQGRGYVGDGVNIAADFLINEFQKAGLKPYFGDTSYVQHFSFNVNTFPGKMKVKVGGKSLRAGEDFLVDHHSGSFSGKLNWVEINIEDLTSRAKTDPLVEQVIIGKKNSFFIDLSELDDQKMRGLLPELNQLATLGPVVYKVDTKFTWSVGRNQYRFPIVWIQKESFKDQPIRLHIEAELVEDFPNRNIAGVLPSSKKDADTLVFTAHYDHLGMMGKKAMFPGGNDNASGTSMLLSMAHYFQQNPSDYHLIFIAFAGEEVGLLGSKYFVENKSISLSSIHFLINLDIMGSGEEGITVVNGKIFEEEFEELQTINREKGYLQQVKSRGATANSDHHYFYENGVPCFFIYTMGPNKNYHDIYDTYDELSFAAYNDIVHLLVEFVER